MANMVEAGMNQFGGGAGGQFPIEQWFYEMPLCTRIWTTATIATSVLVQCNIVTPFQLFYSLRAVFNKNQYWRLFTSFFYFGPLSIDLLLHVFFMQRYSRLLEESFGGSAAHYAWLLAYASGLLLCISPMFSMPYLGQSLSSTLVYIWSRRNPDTRLSFLGIMVFRAPYLPWVLLLFSLVFYQHVPKDEVCGIVIGHIYYFFTDIFPRLYEGSRPLDPPSWWLRLFERRIDIPEATGEEVHLHTGDLAPAPEVR